VKYKNLKSVAHNFGHSFTSDLNWAAGDHVMSHLARAAIVTGRTELEADVRRGSAGPAELLPPPVRESLGHQSRKLDMLLASQRADPARVLGARLRVRLEVARRSTHPSQPSVCEIPFECVVELTDDRGVVHRGVHSDYWRLYEQPGHAQPWR
jgi:hypothetical protein